MSVIPRNPAVEPSFDCATYILNPPKILIPSPLSIFLSPGVSYLMIMSPKLLGMNNNNNNGYVTINNILPSDNGNMIPFSNVLMIQYNMTIFTI